MLLHCVQQQLGADISQHHTSSSLPAYTGGLKEAEEGGFGREGSEQAGKPLRLKCYWVG